MTTILLRSWLSIVLSFMSTFSPTSTGKETTLQPKPIVVIAQATHKSQVIKAVAVKPLQETAPLMAMSQRYMYTFSGQASHEGQPSSNASLEIQVLSNSGLSAKKVWTDSTGRYRVTIPLTGQPNETVSWEIHVVSSDLKKADLEGHQIILGEPSIQMEAPVLFVES